MKTKIIIAVVAVIFIALAFLGIRYRDNFITDPNATAGTQETTTLKPFVDAQTQIVGGATTNAETTTKEKVTAKLVASDVKSWPTDKLLNGLPKPDTRKISASLEYKTTYGKQIIIRFDKFSYSEFLNYAKRVEKAGFADNNDRYHIPEAEPTGTAMFYYSYDGERSFGIYWHGEKSLAGFDCEIVICDYDQAK